MSDRLRNNNNDNRHSDARFSRGAYSSGPSGRFSSSNWATGDTQQRSPQSRSERPRDVRPNGDSRLERDMRTARDNRSVRGGRPQRDGRSAHDRQPAQGARAAYGGAQERDQRNQRSEGYAGARGYGEEDRALRTGSSARGGDRGGAARNGAHAAGVRGNDARPAVDRTARDARNGNAACGARAASARDIRGGGRSNARGGGARNSARNAAPEKKKASIGKRIALVLLILVLLVGGGIAIYVNVISGNLHKGVTQDVRNALVKTEYSKEPFYMLLLGTDESQERATDETYGGSFRSDSMMLARIDCPNKKVTLISLERDTLLDMGDAGWQKLNAASAIGGPAYAIEMVSKMAHDTPISHYALIDFDGFCDVVNALGGIDVDVPIEIDDDDAGGYLAAGPQTLNGDQALILCRSRHAYEEYGSGNSYRSANQRMVLSAIAQKILASDIGTIASTVGTLSKYLSTDLGINDIIGIAQALRGLDMSSDMYTAMQPTTSLYEDGMWYNTCDEPEWKEMLDRVNQGLPPTETDVVDATGTVLATTGSGQALGGSSANEFLNKKSGTVVIRNGGAPAGSGGKVGEVIAAMGYTTDIANANSSDFDETVIVYQAADKRSEAMEIARAMGIGRVVKNDAGEYLMNGDFLVVLGSDYGA